MINSKQIQTATKMLLKKSTRLESLRKHEINKRIKANQKRRVSAKSQVTKRHKRKHKDKQAHRK